MSMSSHQSAKAKTVEWLTPPEWIEVLAPFDLDPCCPRYMPWKTAKRGYCRRECDGLTVPWHGRVWLNPPFGNKAAAWLRRLRDHGNGIALIPARTETAMFYESVWGHADAVCFVKGRPHFHVGNPEGAVFKRNGGKEIFVPFGGRAPCNSGAPIALIAYGRFNLEMLLKAALGVVVATEYKSRPVSLRELEALPA